jgi:polar amino acid transport system permease protein
MSYDLNFNVIWANFDKLLGGLGLGLLLAVISLAVGAVIGLAAALAATGRSKALRGLVAGYVTAIRNTPLLILVLFTFFALPELGVRFDRFESFAIALVIYAGAYLCEVFRAALTGIPLGLIDAGRALGLRQWQITAKIRLPIMFRNALPALGSTFISLFKDTSIAAVIAVPELTYQARRINVDSFRVIEAWMAASVLYLATCLTIAAGLRLIERRLSVR